MKAKFFFPAALFASVLIAPAVVHALQPVTLELMANPAEVSAADERDKAYADGTRAINEARWADAATIFSKIATQRGDRADAAMYWKAYAENKEGQSARAIETCTSLGQTFAKSRYLSDCDALRVEIQGPSVHVDVLPIPPIPPIPPMNIDVRSRIDAARTIRGWRDDATPANPEEDIKLLALQAVMQQDEARALPAIQQILNGNGSDRLKERALFVLAQSKSPQAQQTLGQIARGQSNPALQVKAIRMYAAVGGKNAVDTLADIYQHTSDANVKRTILQSYLMTGSSDKLLAAARGEQNPELVKSAVRSLGAMRATSDLSTLYTEAKDQQVKLDIINSLVASGPKGAEALKSIATSEQNPNLRSRAIRNLGVSGGASAAPTLVAAYQGSADAESKRAALDGLFISGNAHELVTLARAEKDPALRQIIVSKLSVMRSKEATDYMMEILNK
ncbi:MAG: HEAT repeat domain-containing protein [Acidobacteria bacterium]|nr:HEAT repeat domain-containing protein [Acidobacteriota bacterium]